MAKQTERASSVLQTSARRHGTRCYFVDDTERVSLEEVKKDTASDERSSCATNAMFPRQVHC